MKLIPGTHELISNMRAFFQPANSKYGNLNEEPLRAELLSSDQLEKFGIALAGTHKLSHGPAKDHLLKRLAENEHILNEVRKLIADSIKKKYQITPAGEWLIDNFYLIEEHISNAKLHFPKGYSEDLPQVEISGAAALTRIYDIVLQIISHSDGRIDIDSLGSFINAYQTVTKLQLGELWAIPIMLRLALIENLRRVSARIAIDRVDGNLADYWADKMIETAEKSPKDLILVIADMARSKPPMVSMFVSELTRQLRGKGPDLALTLNWMEQQLTEIGLTSAELIGEEIQKQSANQVSISNSIGSLRLLGSMDWREFVETHSVVEQTLRQDPAGIYPSMDFYTRDQYRHVVENIAKKSSISENEVAQLSIKLAQQPVSSKENDDRTKHVGYYLVGDAVTLTKKAALMKEPVTAKFRKGYSNYNLKIYTGLILIITLAASAAILISADLQTDNNWILIPLAVLSVICTSQLAISIVNFFATLTVNPHLLPRMNYESGIPSDQRTMVVIPVMLTSEADIEEMVESLEVRFLANNNKNLHFALLTDFTDAKMENMPADQALVELAKTSIEELNLKYGRLNNELFYLFHRPRRWNKSENAWMGYERKRGKLTELNNLLRGKGADRFSEIIGDQSVFRNIKYIITLDADTQLPLGAAWKLIGTMAHPLNRAWYDERRKRICKGYGILQPRVNVSLPETTGSLYARMHGNEPGIDPYTQASSDVYQDVFEEGSFIGKGIYEVDIFRKVLDDKFAENSILSHDLLEGCYVRSGLVSDVQLFEKYPTSYRADMKRRSRWIRGDWQILSWLLPFVPGPGRHWQKNPVSALSKWKILDNIRRSLVPPAITALLIFTWIVLPASAFWTIIVSGIILIPIFITALWDAIHKPSDVNLIDHLKYWFRSFLFVIAKTLFTLICLPYEAYVNLKAIFSTLWKMLFTRKKMLEWDPSANDEKIRPASIMASYSSMWIEVFLPLVILAYLAVYAPSKLFIAVPIMLLWMIAPFITWFISKPLAKQVAALSETQVIFLRALARKTWHFFEEFVIKEDNWLPPDNYQEEPVAIVAHRTSPTNIGMTLLANLSARDFGYITTAQFIERTSNTIESLLQMEKFNGHFYNWYDTRTLDPLFPKYVSTVDSGNLAGHLIVLRQGLLASAYKQMPEKWIFKGIQDTSNVLLNTLADDEKKMIRPFLEAVNDAVNVDIYDLVSVKNNLENLQQQFAVIEGNLNNDVSTETYTWKQKLQEQLKRVNEDFDIFMPWILLKNAPEKLRDHPLSFKFNSLYDILKSSKELLTDSAKLEIEPLAAGEKEWLNLFQSTLNNSIQTVTAQINAIETLAMQCNKLADMEWEFLYNKATNLFAIGFNVQDFRRDASYYDLLASEARLAIFVCISQGKIPADSWFALGRLITNVEGNPVLLSWSGSMFEYLMPLLVMPNYDNTLLDQTYKSAVRWQIEYGKHTGLPWGISESGYNRINAESHYQYKAFGAPGLGLKRGLEEDAVIAPYASAMALMVFPEKASENLELLQEKGFEGRYGFYEAIDYTSTRLPRGQSFAIVNSFMVHHQGMSLLSLSYLLQDKPMQRYFESEPMFKATLLLLQERIPKTTTFYAHTTDIADSSYTNVEAEIRIIKTPHTPIPQVQLLSNSRYHAMVTNAGGGYSKWKDLAVTRWREDTTRDNWGTFCYINDIKSGSYWSNTFQPVGKTADKYEVAYSQGRVDFLLSQEDIETKTEIVVSPEDDIEMRRLFIKNLSGNTRTIEVTSYSEVVMASPASDAMQPAFSSLFVQTEILDSQHAILCTRRPRSADEHPPFMFHLMSLQGKPSMEISYETDRMKFIGRGNSPANPSALNQPGALSGSQGSVLDPIVSIRHKITLEPKETVTVDMIIGIADTRATCENLINKYQDKHHKDRVFELAWTHSQVVLRHINATEADAQLYGRLASSIIFANAGFRADPSILINNHRGQSGLWGYSISGDLPILLLKVANQANMQLVKQLVQAHAYWRLKGLEVDLVIWNEEHNVYRQGFQNDILALIPVELRDKPGGIFVRASDQISNEDRILFQTVARINITDADNLAEFVKRKPTPKSVIPAILPVLKSIRSSSNLTLPVNLLFFNGIGGFAADGKEYYINIQRNHPTPAPWINVLANPGFGSIISESGSGYTWMENAHELRLSSWNNDPVCDTVSEAFYIRDDESGQFWSTSYLPTQSSSNYITRHGFGYSIFEHLEEGIYTEMTVFVDLEASVKFYLVKISNRSGRPRKISATGYTDWVLGDSRLKTSMHIRSEFNPETGLLTAQNQYSTAFGQRVGFFDTDNTRKTITADRTEFLGRNGSLKNPEALSKTKLSGKIGLALDPCAAMQVPIDLADGETQEIIFRLGAGADMQVAEHTSKEFRGNEAAHRSLEKVKAFWQKTLGALQVETPDIAINLITNGWLIYQTLSCRLWGRSGFYQSGGAFGFRDQLQDVMSLLHAAPEMARHQIVLCASRQFKEGDVQHWWHPPVGNGVRTQCSDDFLWLPLVTAIYVATTGDYTILEAQAHYLEGRLLDPHEESYYDQPVRSQLTATVYEHCVLAIKHGFRYGEHGLPLIGSGDWNDGFDKVGEKGKGESVWMAFFLYYILQQFEPVAISRKDNEFATLCKKEAQQLKENIEKNAWDGQWYKRAWFDDGTALGTSANDECKIDSIAQSWSVISGAGNKAKINTAMESAYKNLVQKDVGIIKLLEPAFDKSDMNPGYIKGYVPGVRENGGQYTHAAVWMIMAFAKLGDRQKVWELLNMINPVNHGKTATTISVYKVEPYVLAADVYARSPHEGRGGWTWYTGSAGWMYRLITESFLGLVKELNMLTFNPCIPGDWPSFKVSYRFQNTVYNIMVLQEQTEGNMTVYLDDVLQPGNAIPLSDDKIEHNVKVNIFSA